ncbi:MAG: hypothetical protein M3Z11_12130 [Candidatus Dormibacteraeota bacterium]|nr:hypothetical protein [Candidatus Dormibacteraeota bacterium]
MEKEVDDVKPEHHETLIERVGDEIESRFLAAAEVATGTTSAETNLATAALRAIEGPAKPEPPAEPTSAPDPAQDARTETTPT